jgi:hypothetical protein
VDAKTRDALVTEFRAAFNLDADEGDIAGAVLAIHERVSSNHDLYVAAADQLTAKERGAIKKYIIIAKEKNRG